MNKDGELYLGDHATRPSLRFTCNLSGTLKAEVDANPNKKIAMLCYPKKIFDLVLHLDGRCACFVFLCVQDANGRS